MCKRSNVNKKGRLTMIVSASRRTDIPTYYSDWFYNRIKEGFVLVRNPMNIHQIGIITLSPKLIDGIVFWTKNPTPMIGRLDELRDYTHYFQFTLNAYGKDVEPGVPSKNDIVIPSFRKLSKILGKDKVIWRYDPILFTEKYTTEYHLKYFEVLALKLANYTEKCTISFLDFYKNTKRNIQPLNIITPTIDQKTELMQRCSEISKEYGIYVDTCAEDIDLNRFGIGHAACIDRGRFEHLGGYKLTVEKDTSQRVECCCISSIDIGAYNTCKNGCLYCYANYSFKTVKRNHASHDPESPLLFGRVAEGDLVKVRNIESCRDYQLRFLRLV
jgi:hypothetical protein